MEQQYSLKCSTCLLTVFLTDYESLKSMANNESPSTYHVNGAKEPCDRDFVVIKGGREYVTITHDGVAHLYNSLTLSHYTDPYFLKSTKTTHITNKKVVQSEIY